MALEFLQVAEVVAREKNIDRELVLQAMEQAIQMAAKRKFGIHLNIQATIDRMDGSVSMKKLLEVVNEVQEPISMDEVRMAHREGRPVTMRPALDGKGKPLARNDIQILEKEANKLNPTVQLGEFIVEDMPPMDYSRVAAQAAKQVIFQKVRDAEREKEFDEYHNSTGQLISGIVKRTDTNGLTLDLGRAEAFMPKDEIIPRETYRQGDRVRGYVYKVQREARGPQIFISRTHPQFLAKLFEEEVPEISTGTIEIMGVARDPGFRAKMAVKSHDRNLDPKGVCIGIRGARVQSVTQELQGERIDIIEWTPDAAQFLIRALEPAEVTKVVQDEEEGRMDVVVPEEKLSIAIGRRGQNVRLASIITGWDIDIMTEQEESERRTKEHNAIIAHFMSALDVDDTLARLLIAEGFSSVAELLMVSAEELGNIEGLDADIGAELQRRAQAAADAQANELKELGVEEDLASLTGLTQEILLNVARQGIKTRDDLADLATDELMEMLPEGMLTKRDAQRLITEARKHWFTEEEAAPVPSSKVSAGTQATA